MSQYYNFNVNYTQGGSSIYGDGSSKMAMQDAAKTAAKTAYDTASQGAKDRENNAIYDTGVRTYKVAAVASLAIGNHQEAALVHAYNMIDFGHKDTKQYLNSLGCGTANRDILNSFKQDVFFEGQAAGSGTGVSYISAADGGSGFYNKLVGNDSYFSQSVGKQDYYFNRNDFKVEVHLPASSYSSVNPKPMSTMISQADVQNGYFMHKGQQISLDGYMTKSGLDITDSKVVSLYGGNGPDIVTLRKNAINEENLANSVLGATTHKQKIEALGILNNNSLDYIKNVSPELKNKLDTALGSGVTRGNQRAAIASVMAELRAELASGKCTPARQAQIQQMTNLLKTHNRIAGGNVMKSSKLDMMHRQGWRTIGKEVLGDDMMKGIDFYSRTAIVTKHSVKAVSHVAYKTGSYAADATFSLAERVAKKVGNTGLEKFANRGKMGVRNHREYFNARRRARKGGKESWKNFKRQQRNNKLDKKLKRVNKKILRRQNQGRMTKALERKAARLAKKQGKKAVKKSIKMALKAAWEAMKASIKLVQQVAQLAADIAHIANALSTAVGNITGIISAAIVIIKYALIAIGIAIVLALLIYELSLAALATITMLAMKLFSLPSTDLTGMLNSVNYNQYIVDKVCVDLGGDYLEVAQRDAQLHFLFDKKVPSDGDFDWYKDTIEGSIGHVWAREECDNTTEEGGELYFGDTYVQNKYLRHELEGPNANIVPIMAMMGERFEEEINFNNYHNAMAYVYYMYVVSHNISVFDSNDPNWDTDDLGYEYIEVDDCALENLYQVGGEVWDTSTSVRVYPAEACSNVYIHGYDKNVGGAINEAKAKAGSWIKDAASSVLGFFGLDSTIPLPNVSVGSVVTDDVDISTSVLADCDHILYYQYSNVENQSYLTCGKTAHQHSDANGCYSHSSGSWNCAHYCTPGNCYTVMYIPNPHGPGMIPGPRNYFCSHTCDASSGCSYTPGPKYLSCTKEEHTHDPWNSASDPGCWKTVAVCGGHCGGHIQPVVNIALTVSWEGLMREDVFKQTYWMSDSEFEPRAYEQFLAGLLPENYKLSSWKSYWNKRIGEWYIPFPRGPLNLIQTLRDDVVWFSASTIDSVTAYVAGELNPLGADGEITEEAMDLTKDVYGWQGWWIDDQKLNMGLVGDLTDLNGTYEDNFRVGKENWAVMDVAFPVGPTKAYTAGEIGDIIDAIRAMNPHMTEQQESIVREALESAGQYWYQDSPSAKTNGCNSESGCSDPFGFVGGVLNRAGVGNYTGPTSSTWAGGSVPSTMSPGSVVTMIDGEDSYVSICLGAYTDPCSGQTGYWVVDCISDTNGAAVRCLSRNDYLDYTYRKSY